ncbi:UMP kinase [Nanoarchaeota archaeon]
MGELIVLSVGGSVIAPEAPDIEFLKRFREFVLSHIEKGYRFAIVAGGGKVCRVYQDAARGVRPMTDEDLDWIGIYATMFNANFVRQLFNEVAHPRIIVNPTEAIDFKEQVLVASGWLPGCSTDYDTVLLAKNLGAKKLVNLSNIDHVYDKDPNKNPDAKPINDIGWGDFRALLPEKWDPGLHVPFDPVAAAEAEKDGMEVVIMDGKDLASLENYLLGKEFKGTLIR